ncbi:unnamed protein product [Ectocarpus sp. 4 AP-2014]
MSDSRKGNESRGRCKQSELAICQADMEKRPCFCPPTSHLRQYRKRGCWRLMSTGVLCSLARGPRRGDSKTSNVQAIKCTSQERPKRLVDVPFGEAVEAELVDRNAAHSWHADTHRRRSSHFLSLHRSQPWQHALLPPDTRLQSWLPQAHVTHVRPEHMFVWTPRDIHASSKGPTPPRNNCQDTRYSNVSSSSYDRSLTTHTFTHHVTGKTHDPLSRAPRGLGCGFKQPPSRISKTAARTACSEDHLQNHRYVVFTWASLPACP